MRERMPAALAGQRVDRVVALLTGLSRREVDVLIDGGAVRIAGRPVGSRSRRVAEGEVVEVDVPDVEADAGPEADPAVAFAVVHEDRHVIVVDKPAGLVVHPGSGVRSGTLVHGLLARYPELAEVGPDPERPGIVHRLDAGTSGLLVVARTAEAHESLAGQMAGRSAARVYETVVDGVVAAPAGLIDGPLGRDRKEPTRRAVVAGGKEARTRYRVEDRYEHHTRLECRLETGRTHQIRAHLRAIGHPVAADAVYGGRPLGGLSRPYLHARRLAFRHPATGEEVSFESLLPAELLAADAHLA